MKDVEYTLVVSPGWVLIPALENLITVTLLFLLDGRLALLAMLVFPVAVLGPRFFSPRVAEASTACKLAEGSVVNVVQENLGAQPVVKGFSLESRARERFAARSLEQRTSGLRFAFTAAMLERSAGAGTYVLQVVVLGSASGSRIKSTSASASSRPFRHCSSGCVVRWGRSSSLSRGSWMRARPFKM